MFSKAIHTVIAKIDEPYAGVKRYVLRDPDEWGLPPFLPCAHIDLYLQKDLVRTYSLCNVSASPAVYEIAVKLEKGGRGGSAYIHVDLKEGMRVDVSLPRGGIRPSLTSHNLFIAGGNGVTPFVSAIRFLEAASRANYELHWISRCKHSTADMFGRMRLSGRIFVHDTSSGVRPDLARVLAKAPGDSFAYCCGPAGMLDEFEALTKNWSSDRIHIERFVPPVVMPSPDARPFKLVLARSGKELDVGAGNELLAALRQLDADVPVSCGGGICGACRTRWIEGPPIHRDRVLSPAEREKEVIVCVAQCGGERLVLDL